MAGAPTPFSGSPFRWMFAGSLLSMLGDQFILIALPWLLLQLTGDPFALGAALALIGAPRALFIFIGGAAVDRHSPARVLLISRIVSAILLGGFALALMRGWAGPWMCCALALAIGISTAFSLPSGTALLPQIVEEGDLHAANGVMLAARQATMCIGPLGAGLLIALDSGAGMAAAFAVTAVAFALSAATLLRIVAPGPAAQARQQVWRSIREGWQYCWRDRGLRTCLLYWGALGLFISGPIQVAIPVQARDFGSARAFGGLMAAYGAGTFAGMLLSVVKGNWRLGSLGTTVLAVDFVVAGLVIAMGWITAVWQGAALLLLIGAMGGYLHAAVFTWMQRRVPQAMMGRAMSWFTFIFVGIAPLSAAVAGWLMRSLSPAQLYLGSGLLLLGIVSLTFLASPMRQVADAPA